MPRRRKVNMAMARTVAVNASEVLPVLQKQLLRLDAVHTKNKLPASIIQLMLLLGNYDGITVSQISAHLGIAKPNVTPLIDRLVAEGYAERRRRVQLDRRTVRVFLLPEGEKLVDQLRNDMAVNVAEYAAALPEHALADMNKALKALSRVLMETAPEGADSKEEAEEAPAED